MTALSYDDILLVPQEGVVDSRSDVDISIELGKWTLPTPFISSPMETVTGLEMAEAIYKCRGGLGVLHRFGRDGLSNAWVEYMRFWGLGPVATAIGLNDHERLYMEYKPDIFVLDVAHAHSRPVIEWVKRIKKECPDVFLIAGSVATHDGALALLDAGADGLRVGIGSGAACTTRLVTGFGVPMVTAIEECADAAPSLFIVADGGIKNSGDVVKALAVGANAVMIGRLFAGCDEAPRGTEYFGQASSKAHSTNGFVEGASGQVEPVGPVAKVIEELSYGLRSGISYGGAKDLRMFYLMAKYNQVTPLAAVESGIRI